MLGAFHHARSSRTHRPLSWYHGHNQMDRGVTRSHQASKYRRLYSTARWKALRLMQLAAHPLCRMCLDAGSTSLATVADHIRPHRGDERLFFDPSNLQSLCKRCHDRDKQSVEHGGLAFHGSVDRQGWPTDPRHRANWRR